MHGNVTMNNKPNPYVVGFSIGLCIGVVILVAFRWFPWVGDQKYKQLRDFLFFAVGFFIILVRRYWNVRRVPRFWLALSILVVAHSAGCWLYITRVSGLGPMQFILIAVVESFPAVFFINWFARVSGEERVEEH